MQFVDSHAHLTSDALYPEIDAILERAKDAGIESVINICTDVPTLERGLVLAERYPWVYNTASTTPHDVESEGEEVWDRMAATARSGKLVAVGETGLDYFYEHSNRDLQKEFLRRYLHMALECDLPVVIHCRDAFEDFFEIIDNEYVVNGQHAPGVLHCFTGTLEEAKQVIERGWYLSLSGIVTFKRSAELREVAKWVPLDRLFIETDAPYLAPQRNRGKQNEPAFVTETAEVIANEKNLDLAKVAQVTRENAHTFFGISASAQSTSCR